MSQMWNDVTIENPGTITIESLDGAFTGDGQMWEDVSVDDWRDTIPAHKLLNSSFVAPERVGDPNGAITVSGGSKYQADDLIEAIMALSTKHPEATITHFEEWTGEDPETKSTVYRAGEVVRDESMVSDLVPANLGELVLKLRLSLDAQEALALPFASDVMAAARALVDALDPKGASK